MLMSLSRSVTTVAAMGILCAACGGDEGEAGEDAEPQAVVSDADTTGAAIWAHLQSSNYQTEWSLWPGKGRLYTGQVPHGMLLTTHLNSAALRGLLSGASVMPAGAIIVKENYMPDSTLAAVTTMYKVPGYNPDHADWFFTKHLPSGVLETMSNGMDMEGRLSGCQSCHIGKRDNDYIFTSDLGGGN